MSEQTDPITLVYDRLWELITASDAVTAMVKAGNRVNFSGDDQNPMKREVTDADTPEITIGMGALSFDAFSTTRDGVFTQAYPVILVHEDMRFDRVNALKWELLKAVSAGGAHLGVTVSGVGQFVDKWTIQNAADTPNDAGRSHGMQRMVTVLTVVVNMRWPRALLTPNT